ncbi:hypothetical protein NUU61_002812 [Penicillium alfredii]|uniref:Proline iminopeptidase n=1 Tax=Penicillium alfredii TaxID=1506179 RepID=A0A9W9KGD2_9EURO|nr:uncharacterized protein NUU61_002812 [Penicillium alfredii]KAJ5105465.1 hypothetical protein NUU61_002812 [Penicillium alfredii]
MSSPISGYAHEAPFDQGMLPVSAIHKLHYEQYGKKDGKPGKLPILLSYLLSPSPPTPIVILTSRTALYLHGGPGGQTSKANTAYFDPAIYRVVLFDQRGAGRSTPSAELRENTSAHLVADIEVLRQHLQIPQWHLIFGGSWGSTLALLYAQAHPDAIGGALVMRGIFTARRAELEWSRGPTGASQLFPDAYEAYLNFLKGEEEEEEDRADDIAAYYRILAQDEDSAQRRAAAREWNRWNSWIGTLRTGPESFAWLEEDEQLSLVHARLEAHYFVHGVWLEEGQILREENLERIRHIPVTLVQGRYDLVCPPQTAWELHKGLPKSRLIWIPAAGHSGTEPGTQPKLIEACDEYAKL